MEYRDLKLGDKYILAGRLLKKGLKRSEINQLFKIIQNENKIDIILDELTSLLNISEEKMQKETLEKEITLVKKSKLSSTNKKGTIVIAEKEPIYTNLLKKESIAQFYYIIHAENGIPGLKKIQKIIPLIAVIDFDTYGISEKYESLKIIQRQYKDIPIIMLCNIIPDDLKERFNQNNLVSYKGKPITGKQLQEIIQGKIEV